MTPNNEERLEKAEQEFIKDVGVGQVSRYRFAMWLYENEPALSEYIIEDYLDKRVGTAGVKNENQIR